MNKRLVALASVMMLVGSLAATAWANPPGLIEVTSHNSFATTVTKMKSAIAEHGLMTLKEFNQQMMLNMVGVHSPAQVTFEIFHPKYGATVYSTNRLGFLAVPLRVTVLQQGGAVKIAYVKPSDALAPYGLSGLGEQLDPIVSAIVAAAAQ
ncbi:MAG: DUF302 domain-containing protein [Steroidobacteraceae bacterium]